MNADVPDCLTCGHSEYAHGMHDTGSTRCGVMIGGPNPDGGFDFCPCPGFTS